jgi:hypothetical protein
LLTYSFDITSLRGNPNDKQQGLMPLPSIIGISADPEKKVILKLGTDAAAWFSFAL